MTPVRERELARVRPLVERSALGEGGVVQVVADPGLGKSAFAAAVAQEASAHAVHRAVCGQFGGATGYNAVRRLLRDVLGLGGGKPEGRAGGGAACPGDGPLPRPVADTSRC